MTAYFHTGQITYTARRRSVPAVTLVLLVLLFLTAFATDAKEFWVAEKVDLAPGHDYAIPVLHLDHLHDGRRVSTPGELLHQGDEYWVCGKVDANTSGSYALSLAIQTDAGQPLAIPLRRTQKFEFGTIDVALVIDVSASMKRNDPNDLRKTALRRFFQLARNSDRIETISLIAFETESRILLRPTPPAAVPDLEPYLRKFQARASTNFDKPFRQALNLLAEGIAQKKAVLFLSDGRPVKKYRRAHEKFTALDCPIHSIGLSEESDEVLLSRISKDTGGSFFNAPSADQLTRLFIQIFHLIDKPQTVLKQTLDVGRNPEMTFLVDATMQNTTVTCVPVSGSHTATLNGNLVYSPETTDLQFYTMPHDAAGKQTIAFSGNGKAACEVMAATELYVNAIQLNQDGPAGLPLAFFFYLAGTDSTDEAAVECVVRRPGGETTKVLTSRNLESSIYSTTMTETAVPGVYKVFIRVSGEVAGSRFLRATTLTYVRTGDAEVMDRNVGRVNPDLAPTELETERPVFDPTATKETAVRSQALKTTYWASADELHFDSLYPGVAETQEVTILISPADPTPISCELTSSGADGVTLHLEGDIEKYRKSTLTITAVPTGSSAGRVFFEKLRIRMGDSQWQIPVTASVGIPRIITKNTAPAITETDEIITAYSHLNVHVAPAGRCALSIGTNLAPLQIEPDRIMAGQKPTKVALRLRLELPLNQYERAGKITISGEGLQPVTVPYGISIRKKAEPPPVDDVSTQVEVTKSQVPWKLLLILLYIILLMLLVAAIRGNRRAGFLLGSITIHILILLFILPKQEISGEERRMVTTMTVTSGEVLREEQIRSELAEFTPTQDDPDELAAEKEEAEIEEAVENDTQELETEEFHEPTELTEEIEPAEPVEPEPVQPEDLKPEPTEIERKHDVAEETLADEQTPVEATMAENELPVEPEPDTQPMDAQEIRGIDQTAETREVDLEVERQTIDVEAIATEVSEFERKRELAEPVEQQQQELTEQERIEVELQAEDNTEDREMAVSEVREVHQPAESQDVPIEVERNVIDTAVIESEVADVERKWEEIKDVEQQRLDMAEPKKVEAVVHIPESVEDREMTVAAVREVEPDTGESRTVTLEVERAAIDAETIETSPDAVERKRAESAEMQSQRQAMTDDSKVDAVVTLPNAVDDREMSVTQVREVNDSGEARQMTPDVRHQEVTTVMIATETSEFERHRTIDLPETGNAQRPAVSKPRELHEDADVEITITALVEPSQIVRQVGDIQARVQDTRKHITKEIEITPVDIPDAVRPREIKRKRQAAESAAPPQPVPADQQTPTHLPASAATPTTRQLSIEAVETAQAVTLTPDAMQPRSADSIDPAPFTPTPMASIELPAQTEQVKRKSKPSKPAVTATAARSIAPPAGSPSPQTWNADSAISTDVTKPLEPGEIGARVVAVTAMNSRHMPRTGLGPVARHQSAPRIPLSPQLERIDRKSTTPDPVQSAVAPIRRTAAPTRIVSKAPSPAPAKLGRKFQVPGIAPKIHARAAHTKQAPLKIEAGDFRTKRRKWDTTLPLLKYSGDWDCDPTAMGNLAHQMERRTGSLIPFNSDTIDMTSPELQDVPFIFMTGHKDFKFTYDEIISLRKFTGNGGLIWINDSTDIGDSVYDKAVRREIGRVFPRLDWEKIPMDHTIFKGPYDLTNGYKGYVIPPGDKYRQDYIEGLWVDKRLTIVYTRNDYGDGLEIDPLTHPLMTSLSDLSPKEMQEGSIRMGINIATYLMNGGRPSDTTIDKMYQSAADKAKSADDWGGKPQIPFPILDDNKRWYLPMQWENLLATGAHYNESGALVMFFGKRGRQPVTRQDKALVSGKVEIAIEPNSVLLMDVRSHLKGGARLALAFSGSTTGSEEDNHYVESSPAYIKPGANTGVSFDFRAKAFKTEASDWKYTAGIDGMLTVTDWYFVLYPQVGNGKIEISDLRLVNP